MFERVFINFEFTMVTVFIIVIIITPTSLINTKSIVDYFVTNSPLAFTS